MLEVVNVLYRLVSFDYAFTKDRRQELAAGRDFHR